MSIDVKRFMFLWVALLHLVWFFPHKVIPCTTQTRHCSNVTVTVDRCPSMPTIFALERVETHFTFNIQISCYQMWIFPNLSFVGGDMLFRSLNSTHEVVIGSVIIGNANNPALQITGGLKMHGVSVNFFSIPCLFSAGFISIKMLHNSDHQKIVINNESSCNPLHVIGNIHMSVAGLSSIKLGHLIHVQGDVSLDLQSALNFSSVEIFDGPREEPTLLSLEQPQLVISGTINVHTSIKRRVNVTIQGLAAVSSKSVNFTCNQMNGCLFMINGQPAPSGLIDMHNCRGRGFPSSDGCSCFSFLEKDPTCMPTRTMLCVMSTEWPDLTGTYCLDRPDSYLLNRDENDGTYRLSFINLSHTWTWQITNSSDGNNTTIVTAGTYRNNTLSVIPRTSWYNQEDVHELGFGSSYPTTLAAMVFLSEVIQEGSVHGCNGIEINWCYPYHSNTTTTTMKKVLFDTENITNATDSTKVTSTTTANTLTDDTSTTIAVMTSTVLTGSSSHSIDQEIIISLTITGVAVFLIACVVLFLIHRHRNRLATETHLKGYGIVTKNSTFDPDTEKPSLPEPFDPRRNGRWLECPSYGVTYPDDDIESDDIVVFYAKSDDDGSNTYLVAPKQWQYDRNKLCLGDLLGEGQFGAVYKAHAPGIVEGSSISIVAAKMLKESATDSDHADFLSELELMMEIECHPNVVAFLGMCTLQEPFFILVEYMANGNLKDYLRKTCVDSTAVKCRLPASQILQFMLNVAHGMAHLSRLHIVHRDLAARNILVDASLTAKIADFGLARDVTSSPDGLYSVVNRLRKMPLKWMAPESLDPSRRTFSTASDVWAFGVTLAEIASLGSTPYPGMKSIDVARAVLMNNFRMPKPKMCSKEFYEIMKSCWSLIPSDRPSFDDLAGKIMSMSQMPCQHLLFEHVGESSDIFMDNNTQPGCTSMLYMTDNGLQLTDVDSTLYSKINHLRMLHGSGYVVRENSSSSHSKNPPASHGRFRRISHHTQMGRIKQLHPRSEAASRSNTIAVMHLLVSDTNYWSLSAALGQAADPTESPQFKSNYDNLGMFDSTQEETSTGPYALMKSLALEKASPSTNA